MHDPAAISVMRESYEGSLSLDEIPKLKTRKLRVYAAIGYMLKHPEQYFQEGYRLNRPFSDILKEMGESDPQMGVQFSLRAGLHVRSKESKRWGGIILTPPEEVIGKPALSDQEQAKAAALVKKIHAEGYKVTEAVYHQLKNFFEK